MWCNRRINYVDSYFDLIEFQAQDNVGYKPLVNDNALIKRSIIGSKYNGSRPHCATSEISLFPNFP